MARIVILKKGKVEDIIFDKDDFNELKFIDILIEQLTAELAEKLEKIEDFVVPEIIFSGFSRVI